MGPLSLAFTLIPLLELLLLVRIGRAIGAGSTLLLLLASAVLGVLVAKVQGRKVLRAWQEALAAGHVPERGVLDGVLVLVGALLLVTPGVITDALALVCLFPATRRAVAGRFARHLGERVARGQVRMDGFGFGFPSARPRGPGPTAPHVGDPVGRARSRIEERTAPRSRNQDVIDTEGEEV